MKILVCIVATLLLSSCAWFPSAKEPPYQLVKTWGGKGNASGQFNEPMGVAVSASEVFVSDARNARIQVFDFDGNFQRMFGEQGRPINLTVANDKLYVADYFNDVIQIYTLQRTFRAQWDLFFELNICINLQQSITRNGYITTLS